MKTYCQLSLFLLFLILSPQYSISYSITDRKIIYSISKSKLNDINVTEILDYKINDEEIKFSENDSSKLNKNWNELNDSKSKDHYSINIKKSLILDDDVEYSNFKVVFDNAKTNTNDNKDSRDNDNLNRFEFKIIGLDKNRGYYKTKTEMISLDDYLIKILPIEKYYYGSKGNNTDIIDNKNKDLKFTLKYSYTIKYKSHENIIKIIESNTASSNTTITEYDSNSSNGDCYINYNLTLPITTFDEAEKIEAYCDISILLNGFDDSLFIKENNDNNLFSLKSFNLFNHRVSSLHTDMMSSKILEVIDNKETEDNVNINNKKLTVKVALDNNSNKDLNIHFHEKTQSLDKNQKANNSKITSIKLIDNKEVNKRNQLASLKDSSSITDLPIHISFNNHNDRSKNMSISKYDKETQQNETIDIKSLLKSSNINNKKRNIASKNLNNSNDKIKSKSLHEQTLSKTNLIRNIKQNNLKSNDNKENKVKISNSNINNKRLILAKNKASIKLKSPISFNQNKLNKRNRNSSNSSSNISNDNDITIKSPIEHLFAIIYLVLLFIICSLCFCISTSHYSEEKDKERAILVENNSVTSET